MSTVSVVTGANSGIGRAIAIYLARQGHEVHGTVRDPERAGKLRSMAADAGVTVHLAILDVADDESVRQGLAEVIDRAGQVDVLVNNAGVGGNSVVEEASPAQILDVTNVNVCGAVRCLQAVLPGMRARRHGAVVNVTSVAGRVGVIAQAPYVASKWALEGLSEELALELAPFGIRVAVVEPGVTKSAIFAKNVDAPNGTGAYDDHYERMFDFYAAGIPKATDPFEVAAVVYEAITTETPRLRYPCSWGGPELIRGRQAMTDEDWVTLGQTPDNAEYRQRFKAAFGLDITPAS
ncbi:MAG TPA: SDR family oxidoreductase [Acidimicrobiales bacterium]|nr:SDR family oxidoreductase [Acidimicrobiales bacterium]